MQRYPSPNDIEIPQGTHTTKLQRTIIDRDGLIVPILVKRIEGTDKFEAADKWQAERVKACRELQWSSILTEDEWNEDDL